MKEALTMPGNWDPEVYRERARQWRDAAAKLPIGETREAYMALAEGYEKLANLIAEDRNRPTGPG
jgi:hypothetical protein